jgi:polar amino acid transport system ATP-binding protein
MSDILEVNGVSKCFGNLRVLDNVDFNVARGEVVCVIGPSGCGKSTLLRCINYLIEPDAGTIRVNGAYIGREPDTSGRMRRQKASVLDRVRPRVGFVFQQFHLWPHLKVIDNITLGPIKVRKIKREKADANALRLLERFELTAKAHAYPSELSGGQKQRVAIARALAMEPDLVLFDEPTSALDPEIVSHVLLLMRELAMSGMTMVVVTHEIGFARQVADRVVFIDGGRIVEQGPAEEVIERPKHERLRMFLRSIDRREEAPSDS